MLDADTVAWAERLLAAGTSQRQTAAKTGLARGTVWKIAHGEIRSSERDGVAEHPSIFRGGPPVHCPDCGRLVHLPRDGEVCLACSTSRPKNVNPLFDGDEPITLEFRDAETLARYYEMRRRARRRYEMGIELQPDE